KPGRARLGDLSLTGSGNAEAGRVGEHGGLPGLNLTDGFTYHLLGNARAFAALRAYAQGFSYFAIAAAAIVDRITDMTVGDTLAKTDVHKHYSLRLTGCGGY